MPSLRQPVGPLPASIYWRRRVVVLAALAVAVAVAAWLTLGQGGGAKEKTAQPLPAPSTPSGPGSITPGATPTGPAITTHPGGTGGGSGTTTGGGTGGSGASTGGSGGGTGGSGTAGGGSDTGGTSNGGGTSTGTTGGSGGSGTGTTGGGSGTGTTGGGTGTGTGADSGGAPPVNTGEVMALPACTASQLTLELAGTQDAFAAKDKPTFELKIHNASGAVCRVDLSQTASAITVSSATGERIWSSADCVSDKQGRWVQVSPANVLTETFVWDRSHSKPQCATPTDTSLAPTGKYSVQAELTGPSGGPIKALAATRLDG
ncbi:hypothetical protein OG455_22550 [Kitasatospora sp. NBC_01287]|uniref:hypothetical protein n=1 Tax=Kitasatospora sp. NBC_01287 TaxID=2903573 RepID=UPI002256995A|nr:hypothetical protein [Kitasatospora sp. NBC_01287]MCX4748260.1 hypothetical protein [Kitasatospora sp. NBC_01287]